MLFSYRLPVVLMDEVGSHLLEVIIQTADEELFNDLIKKCFRQFIISLSIHPVANYLAQHFMRHLKTSEQVS